MKNSNQLQLKQFFAFKMKETHLSICLLHIIIVIIIKIRRRILIITYNLIEIVERLAKIY